MLLRFSAILAGSVIAWSTGFYFFATLAGIDPDTGIWIWIKFYREGLRSPLFTGFLTMGSFLLTLKATILLRIKEIYDEEEYEQDWVRLQEQRRMRDPAAKDTLFYGGLNRLGVALLSNVVFAIISSILQVTLGFMNSLWAIAICLGFAATTLLLLLFLWLQIAANLLRWFAVIERKKIKKLGRD